MDGSLPFDLRRERVMRAKRSADVLEGRRIQTAARRDALVAGMAEARARAAVKSEVDAFLERLQTDHHARDIGSFGRTLSALAKDVNPKFPEIRLSMRTERGLPALDIFGEKNGEPVNIMEHAGGGLTNAVCLGLRAIGVVRAGIRPLLVLDEPDCWINRARAPAFYRVLKQMSERMGFQTLGISHHPLEVFDGGFNVIALSGVPDDPEHPQGVVMTARDGAPGWPDDSLVGMRWVKWRNYAAFADATAVLSPGLNIFVGELDTGKSRIPRFFRGVFYGGASASDEDIRNRTDAAETSIGLENGRVLHWSKKRGTSPRWRLVEKDGSVASVEGATCETASRDVPPWVGKALGIRRVEELDLQIAHQKLPVFLLNEPASRRATVLSVGQEGGYLRSMIALQKEQSKTDGSTLKSGETELSRVLDSLSALEGLDGAVDEIAACETVLASIEADEAEIAGVALHMSRIETAREAASRAERVSDALAGLPEFPDVESTRAKTVAVERSADAIALVGGKLAAARATATVLAALPEELPEPTRTDEVASLGRRIRDVGALLGEARRVETALAALPSETPEPIPTKEVAIARDAIVKARRSAAASMQSMRDTEKECRAIAEEMAEFVMALGEICPTCHGPMHAHSLLEHASPMETT